MLSNTQLMSVKEVAARFHELAQQEKWFDIQDELFAENVQSIEPAGAPYLKDAAGKATVRQKGEAWVKNVEAVHSASTSAPVTGGDYFAVGRKLDLTVAGIGRIQMDEIMMYKVKDGQIIEERFFY